MFTSNLRQALVLSALLQPVLASGALAETLPPHPDASPKPGEQHPSSFPVYFSAPATGSLDYKVNTDRWFGNNSWGGGYRYYEHVRAPSLGFQSVNFHVNARARLFGKQYTGLEVSGATWNPRRDMRSSRLRVVVANKEIFNKRESSDAAFSTTQVSLNKLPFDKKIFGASKRFMLGPIPVKVSGSVRGKVGVNVVSKAYRTSATRSGVVFTGTSFGELYGRMSAGADAGFASAGIRGQVDFVEVRAAKYSKAERFGGTIKYDTRLIGKLCTLEGYLEIYGSLFGFSGDQTILDWDGRCFRRNFGGQSGSIVMGGAPVASPKPVVVLRE